MVKSAGLRGRQPNRRPRHTSRAAHKPRRRPPRTTPDATLARLEQTLFGNSDRPDEASHAFAAATSFDDLFTPSRLTSHHRADE